MTHETRITLVVRSERELPDDRVRSWLSHQLPAFAVSLHPEPLAPGDQRGDEAGWEYVNIDIAGASIEGGTAPPEPDWLSAEALDAAYARYDPDTLPPSLAGYQRECLTWAHAAFPNDTVELRALGLAEEAGELCRAILKRANGVRGTREQWDEEVRKEAGDVLATLAIIAGYEEFSLADVGVARFAVVAARDVNHDPIGPVDQSDPHTFGPCPSCGGFGVYYQNPEDTRVACADCSWEGFDEAVLGNPRTGSEES